MIDSVLTGAGAYEQVFTAHPEWVGKVIADLNFELRRWHTEPGRGSEAVMNISHFGTISGRPPGSYESVSEDASVVSPIETSIGMTFRWRSLGIQSMVNDFTGGSFMGHTITHSLTTTNTTIHRSTSSIMNCMHCLILAIDATAVVPLSFTGVMKRAQEGLELVKSCENSCLEEKYETISKLLTGAEKQQEENYRWIMQEKQCI